MHTNGLTPGHQIIEHFLAWSSKQEKYQAAYQKQPSTSKQVYELDLKGGMLISYAGLCIDLQQPCAKYCSSNTLVVISKPQRKSATSIKAAICRPAMHGRAPGPVILVQPPAQRALLAEQIRRRAIQVQYLGLVIFNHNKKRELEGSFYKLLFLSRRKAAFKGTIFPSFLLVYISR